MYLSPYLMCMQQTFPTGQEKYTQMLNPLPTHVQGCTCIIMYSISSSTVLGTP